jgi:hypothetical protein
MAVNGVEIEVETGRAYEGLDAAHTPRLIVPERYVADGNHRLRELAAWALLSSHTEPTKQFDVVWLGRKAGRFLRAEVQPTGFYTHSLGYSVEGADEFYLPDPGRFENGMNYTRRIETALQNGAEVFRPADLA